MLIQNKLFLWVGDREIPALNTISFSTACGGRYLEGGPSYVYSGGVSESKGKQALIQKLPFVGEYNFSCKR
ncbi:hypothetical protein IBZ20DMU1_56 [Acinetobacter phage DMU1]|nr:hypothetical protein IBZ20DMU1_56 [Acinetobacter phage DMU1]